jgi:hypothetical protein
VTDRRAARRDSACWVTDALLGAMVCAIGLHAAVVSIPLQFGLQLYVSAIEQVRLLKWEKGLGRLYAQRSVCVRQGWE